MANRPSADKDSPARPSARKSASSKPGPKPGPKPARKTAPKKTAPPRTGKARAEQASAQAETSSVDGAQVLKEGVSRLFGRGRELLSEKGPGLLNSLERATVVAIDHTAKGLTAFEKGANDLEAKVGKGLKDLLDRRRGPADSSKPKGPSA